MSNGAEQWCPVLGGFCISEVSFNRGFTVVKFYDTCVLKLHVFDLMIEAYIFN